ncbi:hypothetical protein ABH14_16965 [Brevibacillus brevis]|uniref:hypothetical protein n=1 Tax=Brevibacillus brevis TaxID=1393 RepID=UPI001900D977|nr:hypothetical protein [Brevibacillus brevis]MBH0331467.1 hypothetical protein [Brevibacillus brevis]
MKKRQRNKILKIVARQINSRDYTKLKPVHFGCVDKTISNFIIKKYVTEFHPWWYDQFDNWRNLDFQAELNKHYDKTIQELQKWVGIDMEQYQQYFQLNHKKDPTKQRSNRKPRKQREQPIRKLRNPQEFKIRVNVKLNPTWQSIIAEPAFHYRGYDFFIAHYGGRWVVSDVATGCRVASNKRYKKAIQLAKERIEKNFDVYVHRVDRAKAGETA